MFQGEGNPYSEASQSIDVPRNNDREDGGCTSSDCQSNQSESSTDSRGRLSLLETELQARTRDLDRLKFKIDKMKSHQLSSPATSRREAKPINIKIEVERLRKDKKVMAELLKQSQQELTRKDSVNRKLKMENDKINRNMVALQGKLAENGRTQSLLEELNRVRSELSLLTTKTDRLTPSYQGQVSEKDDRGRYIEDLVMEKEQLKQCLSAIYFKITPYAVSLPSRSVTPPVWAEDVKNSFDQFWEEKLKLQRELEELREQLKSREATSAEPNRTSPECYETTVSECSTDSKSEYLSDETIVKVSRPTAHHDLESEVCRWKEMYQNVYDKHRSAQHTITYHEKKFRKIYSGVEELAKAVCGEETIQEGVSGYNITKVVQKLSEEYKQLKESIKKIRSEERRQTDLQNSVIEAEKTLEEKGRNARTLRNAIGTLQLTSNMETKVASLAETMLLIYNNQLNWLKQLEHNNTLPNSEGEETHSNSPNQCDIDVPIQDYDKVDNRLNCGDAMSCSSESNESSTSEVHEIIQRPTSSMNVECSPENLQQPEPNETQDCEKVTEETVASKRQEDQGEIKIENTEASIEENKVDQNGDHEVQTEEREEKRDEMKQESTEEEEKGEMKSDNTGKQEEEGVEEKEDDVGEEKEEEKVEEMEDNVGEEREDERVEEKQDDTGEEQEDQRVGKIKDSVGEEKEGERVERKDNVGEEQAEDINEEKKNDIGEEQQDETVEKKDDVAEEQEEEKVGEEEEGIEEKDGNAREEETDHRTEEKGDDAGEDEKGEEEVGNVGEQEEERAEEKNDKAAEHKEDEEERDNTGEQESIEGEKDNIGEQEKESVEEKKDNVEEEQEEETVEEKKDNVEKEQEEEGDDKKEDNVEEEPEEKDEEKKDNVEQEHHKTDGENAVNLEESEQETSNCVQTETEVSVENQTDLEAESGQKEQVNGSNEEDGERETIDDQTSENVEDNNEQETNDDNTEENEEKSNGSETKNGGDDSKDNKDDDDKDQTNSNADGDQNNDGSDKTENEDERKNESKEEDSDNKDNTKKEKETKEQATLVAPEEGGNDATTVIDEIDRNEENNGVTEDTTECKETAENGEETSTAEENEIDSKVESEKNAEDTEEEKSVQEKMIVPHKGANVFQENESSEQHNEDEILTEEPEETSSNTECSEKEISRQDVDCLNSEQKGEETIKAQDDVSSTTIENHENDQSQNSVQSTIAETNNSAEMKENVVGDACPEIEPKSENHQVNTIPEADRGNEETNHKCSAEDNEEISETNDEKNEDNAKNSVKASEEVEEANDEKNEENDAGDTTYGNEELSEDNIEKCKAEDTNDSTKDSGEISEANNEKEEVEDTNDSTKDIQEVSEANDQSESINETEVSNDLNTPDNSQCANVDGAVDSEEETASNVVSCDDESVKHAPVEGDEKKINIKETEEAKSEESPCSSASYSLSTGENKDNIKIIINSASSEEKESVTEDVAQSGASNGSKTNVGVSKKEPKRRFKSKANRKNAVESEAERAPVVEQEVTKVVIEPKKTIFFSSMSAFEKDSTSRRRKSKDSFKQISDEALSKRIEELETEMSEMLEVKRHHMKVACDLAEKLEEMKKREVDLQDQLSNAETKSSQEVEVLWKEWSGREQSYQDEIAAWKENVEQQNSVLQRLKADLDQAQQMAVMKEDEIAQLRSLEKEKRLEEVLLEQETQTSDQEEDPNNKELQETVDRLRITSEHYQQQLMENRTVVREVKSIIEGSVAQLVTLKAMGTKHMKREYVYRNNLAQRELDLKHMQSELDKQSIDARAKANIIEKQRNEIRSLREELRKCQKDISAKVEFIEELQDKMQKLISSHSKPNSANSEDHELYTIGRRCIDEQHTLQLEKQKEELERVRQELHLLELKCSDVESAAESSDQQNLSHPGSAGSVSSVSEEFPSGSNLCLCKRKDVHKILKLSEESYLNLLASLVVCLGIQDMKYNKSLQRLPWSQCKDISTERKANQKRIMKIIQELKKEERTVSPRLHHPERSRSTGETEKRRGLVKCISPQNGRSMYISDMIRQAEDNLDKDKPVKMDGRKPASWRPHTSMNDRRIPLELKNGEILALLGNADPKTVPKPALSSK